MVITPLRSAVYSPRRSAPSIIKLRCAAFGGLSIFTDQTAIATLWTSHFTDFVDNPSSRAGRRRHGQRRRRLLWFFNTTCIPIVIVVVVCTTDDRRRDRRAPRRRHRTLQWCTAWLPPPTTGRRSPERCSPRMVAPLPLISTTRFLLPRASLQLRNSSRTLPRSFSAFSRRTSHHSSMLSIPTA